MKTIATLNLILSLLLLAGCNEDAPEQAPQALPGSHYFPIGVGAAEVKVQLAITLQERRTGLMHREGLGADKGMIFISEVPEQQSFYMKNVSFPLEIGFFSPEGVLREIHTMYPQSRETTYSHSDNLQFALEVNVGWFKDNDVSIGAQLDLLALREAVTARGFDPAKVGMRGIGMDSATMQ